MFIRNLAKLSSWSHLITVNQSKQKLYRVLLSKYEAVIGWKRD